jgi:hypothetical protein
MKVCALTLGSRETDMALIPPLESKISNLSVEVLSSVPSELATLSPV